MVSCSVHLPVGVRFAVRMYDTARFGRGGSEHGASLWGALLRAHELSALMLIEQVAGRADLDRGEVGQLIGRRLLSTSWPHMARLN